MIKTVLIVATLAVAAIAHDCGPVIKSAIVRLEGNGVTGNITFTQQDGGNVRVSGRIVGMEKGFYGTHIHETGDLSQGCLSTKAHFNPDGHDHGHPHDEIRHAGDLGNVEFDDSKVANVDFVDHKIALSGVYNILGRALVLHERADDFGKSGHPDSKKTGNAGGRVACGVIGILSEEPAKTNDASIAAVSSIFVLPLVLVNIMV